MRFNLQQVARVAQNKSKRPHNRQSVRRRFTSSPEQVVEPERINYLDRRPECSCAHAPWGFSNHRDLEVMPGERPIAPSATQPRPTAANVLLRSAIGRKNSHNGMSKAWPRSGLNDLSVDKDRHVRSSPSQGETISNQSPNTPARTCLLAHLTLAVARPTKPSRYPPFGLDSL